jgi:hypothetical protein
MSRHLEFRPSNSSPRPVDDNSVVVKQASIRLDYWPGVTVQKKVNSPLTDLERFVLECAITLETLTPEHLETVTGLPRDLLPPLARRLANEGALAKEGHRYTIRPERAAAVLEAQAVTKRINAKRSFIYLPGTDDIIALTPQDSRTMNDLERFEEYRPSAAPAPPGLDEVTRSELLGYRIRQGSVYGLGDEIIDVGDPSRTDDLIFPDGTCSAYLCSALVSRVDDQDLTVLTFHPTRSVRPSETGPRLPLRIELPGPTKLGKAWLALADAPSTPLYHRALWRALAPGANVIAQAPSRLAVGKWRFRVDGLAAEALVAARQNLSVEAAVDLKTDDATIELAVRFATRDQHAERLQALDQAISNAHNDSDNPAPLRRLLAQSLPADARMPQMTTTDDVLARVWALGHYQLAYAFTEPQDLQYD